MGDAKQIVVETSGAHITVRFKGTSMKAVYTKGGDPWLLLVEMVEDRNASIKVSEFRPLAWEAANKWARKLGWLV